MALTRAQMELVASGAYGKVWTYYTADTKATVIAADYFLSMYSDLTPGDLVHVRAVVGGTEVHFDLSILVASSVTVTCLSSASYA